MTLGEWMDQWVTMRSAILRPRTIDSYRSLLRLYIDPAIGRRKLKRVKPEHIQAMLSAICADGKTRSAELCFVLLSAALTDAVRCRRLDVSPMVGVQRPKHIQRRPDAWTPEEIRQYLAAIRDDPYIVAWMLALCCGLRRGEICGLRWEDVDYRQHILRIRNQRQKLADGRLIDQPPKSLAGVRDVPVPDPLMQVLRDRARIWGLCRAAIAWLARCRASAGRCARWIAIHPLARAAPYYGDKCARGAARLCARCRMCLGIPIRP